MKMNDTGERMTYENGGMREPSTGKGAYELVSPFALDRIAVWYELGARKYADRNWEKGIPFGRLIQSAFRHLIRWMQGRRDEDHLAAVCWNVMAMMHFEETGQAEEWNNYPAYKKAERGAFAKDGVALCAGFKAAVREAEAFNAALAQAKEAADNALKPQPDPYHRPYKILAVDFDGCLCTNAWPEIGEPNTKLIYRLKFRRAHGDKLILWTCREGESLAKAVEWCKIQGLEFDAVNENLPEMIEMYGNDCRKIGADVYLDDKAMRVKA
jgi:hypothetical protein